MAKLLLLLFTTERLFPPRHFTCSPVYVFRAKEALNLLPSDKLIGRVSFHHTQSDPSLELARDVREKEIDSDDS